ncbi:phosphate transporter PHO1 homolog 9 [Euphorbia lathyris]|uniref:phosphate transporter PHO1 homolog 9 n=1 Tax=Euphorbia lathyris TaxID=212925 RepID=UPI003313E3B3
MKFGKEFSAQMVPEWQDAYMDYSSLKTILKDILVFKQMKTTQSPMTPSSRASSSSLRRRVTLYRAFSGLTNRYRNSTTNEDEAILISPGDEEEGCYQTMFLNAADEGGEKEIFFFRKLDFEFNKVIKFYKKKVNQVMAEGDNLSRQMNALIALRIKVEKPHLDHGGDINGVSAISEELSKMELEVIHEAENSVEDKRGSDDEIENPQSDIQGFRPALLQVLDHVRINVEPETPVSTIKNIISSSQSDLSYSKEELRKAEQLITRAFIQFHHKLRLIKSYCFLNQLAFSKIMKKYDKVTLRNASKTYLNMVDNSYIGSSEEITKLMERVEATFIKHFSNGNRRRAMKALRPKHKREKHRTTFSLGFLSGCSVALLISLILLIHARDLINSQGGPQYMENIFPLYSLFGFIILHMLMYAANIYFWKRYRVNYAFIFGFKKGTELNYKEVFLLSSCLSVVTLACVLSNLDMEMDERTQSFQAITELVPLGLLVLVLLITFCPFNIIYRSSRFFFIQCAFHCLLAPLYKVTLPDFFLADQLTSQVHAFRNLEFYVCYYGWGDFKRRSNECRTSHVFEIFYFIVAIVPYWTRFLQCLRRLFEEKDAMQAYNSIKYLSTIVAVAMKTSYELKKTGNWLILAAVSSAFATIISTYWDIVVDWGLLRRNSKNPWLRDKLVIPNKSVYFIAMGLNMVLRLAWMQTVLGFTQAPFLHRTAMSAIVACLEIIRRGIWNFFRLENEHLNNVGKYRAFNSVPLPFCYDEDENKGL